MEKRTTEDDLNYCKSIFGLLENLEQVQFDRNELTRKFSSKVEKRLNSAIAIFSLSVPVVILVAALIYFALDKKHEVDVKFLTNYTLVSIPIIVVSFVLLYELSRAKFVTKVKKALVKSITQKYEDELNEIDNKSESIVKNPAFEKHVLPDEFLSSAFISYSINQIETGNAQSLDEVIEGLKSGNPSLQDTTEVKTLYGRESDYLANR
ncbi:MAG: hypothetical protein LBM27_03305 [Lactobacillaceae bacterium]|jgi:hypothetical protein|nr:hypothetical protein [Lactobacillaceae bacterium]